MKNECISLKIGASTRFIIGTSGRISSLERYRELLQTILKQDIAYIPINSGSLEDNKIKPDKYAMALRGMPCIGGSISRDIKNSIIPYLDELDELASEIQSVNTVIVKADGKLKGYNSDALGFRQAIINGIQKHGNVSVQSAVCYGYGGVASVVTSVLQGLGIKVYLTGRDVNKAFIRASDLKVELWRDQQIDLFVNATPATEYPLAEAPNLLEALSNGCKLAFDHMKCPVSTLPNIAHLPA